MTNNNLGFVVSTTLGNDVFSLVRFEGGEDLFDLYKFTVVVSTTTDAIDLSALSATPIMIGIILYRQDGSLDTSPVRYFCGVIARITQTQVHLLEDGGFLYGYEIIIRPKLWLLTLSTSYKIFQNQTTAQIIQTILDDHRITSVCNKVSNSGQSPRLYCVQYGETSYHFIKRLMEEEGIFFYFDHQEGGEQLVLVDNNQGFGKTNLSSAMCDMSPSHHGMALNQIYQIQQAQEVGIKNLQTTDFDYEKPSVNLHVQTQGNGDEGSVYIYPGLYSDTKTGEERIDNWILGKEWRRRLVNGRSTIVSLGCGQKIKVTGHLVDSLNAEYVTCGMYYRIQTMISPDSLRSTKSVTMDDSTIYENRFVAFGSDINYKPPLATMKPRIYGFQTAMVTGPSGSKVYADAMGRIKVRFPWDLTGSNDENSSPWIRVTQAWAANNWGGLIIPRIGMEVVVSFIDGDPDRPLVMGCVYNGDQSPPYLGDEQPHYTTFKSQTIDGEGSNELRFGDEAEKQEIFFFAQRDFNTIIQHARSEIIKEGDDILVMEKGKKTQTLKGEGSFYAITITDGDWVNVIDKGDYKVTLRQGNMVLTLDKGNFSQTLNNGDATLTIKGNVAINATGAVTIKASGDISMESDKAISIKAATGLSLSSGTAIDINAKLSLKQKAGQVGIVADTIGDIKASVLTLSGDAMTKITGQAVEISGTAMTQLKSSALLIIKGSMTMIN